MGKQIQFDEAARRALWRGVDQLACAVRITLGPRGRSVVIDRLHGWPTITRDGIAVAQEIELGDPFENMGVQLLREVALKTGAAAGDGTTTATVLAHRIVGDGLAALAAGHNPIALRRGIDHATAAAVRALGSHARPLEHERDLARIAGIAAHDGELGELVAEALERVGRHGVVTVEDGRGIETTLEVVEGVRFEGNYASPYFVTQAESMEATLDHALVFLVDGRISRAAEIVPALEEAAKRSRPLLVLAEDVEAEALAVLVVNRLRGTVASVGVRAGGTNARRRELFEDLALLTDATLVSADRGIIAERFDPAWFGRVRHVSVDTHHVTMRQGGGRSEAIQDRIAQLSRELATAGGEFDREHLRARIGRVSGTVAVIRVGATNPVEQQERRSRIEDALAATRAAVEEGIVPGGGVALVRAEQAVRDIDLRGAEHVGRSIVLGALGEPARQIAINSGADAGEVMVRMREHEGAYGYNALTGTFGDLEREGVLDPARVTRIALQNAAGMGGLVLTTDAIVVDDSPPESQEPPKE